MALGQFMCEFKSFSAEQAGLKFTQPGASASYLSRRSVDVFSVMKYAAAERAASIPDDIFNKILFNPFLTLW